MDRRTRHWEWLLVAALLACGAPDRGETARVGAGGSDPEQGLAASAPPPKARTVPGGASALPDEPDAVPESGARLDDLLRLPPGAPPDPVAARLRERPADDAAGEGDREPRLRFRVEQDEDASVLHPEQGRERVGVSASTDVGGATRVGAGLQVEREGDADPTAPVPTVGVERRF